MIVIFFFFQAKVDIEESVLTGNHTFGVYTVSADVSLCKSSFEKNGQGAVSVGFDATITMEDSTVAVDTTKPSFLTVSPLANEGCSFKNNIVRGGGLIPEAHRGGFLVASQ